MKEYIKYTKGYPYQGIGSFAYQSKIRLVDAVKTPFYAIDRDGLIQGKNGYAWDGASGPTMDRNKASKWTRRGTYFHDIGCQAIGEGLVSEGWRPEIDLMMLDILLEDAPSDNANWLKIKLRRLRARLWYRGVKVGAKFSKQEKDTEYREIITAPRWSLLVALCLLTSCNTLQDQAEESYQEALDRSIYEDSIWLEGMHYGQNRAIIEFKNKKGETWERYLNTHKR